MTQNRPSLREIAEALRATAGILSLSAQKLGMSRDDLEPIVLGSNELEAIRRSCEQEMLDIAEAKLLQKVRDGNLAALRLFLRTMGRDRGHGNERPDSRPVADPHPGDPALCAKKDLNRYFLN